MIKIELGSRDHQRSECPTRLQLKTQDRLSPFLIRRLVMVLGKEEAAGSNPLAPTFPQSQAFGEHFWRKAGSGAKPP